MFLYIFKNGDIKQVADNPTVADTIAVGLGGLTILKCVQNVFYKLVLEKNKICWTKVEDCVTLSCRDGRFHQ